MVFHSRSKILEEFVFSVQILLVTANPHSFSFFHIIVFSIHWHSQASAPGKSECPIPYVFSKKRDRF